MSRVICFAILFLAWSLNSSAQSSDEKEILGILERQQISWNKGNIDEFMNGYWNSDSLTFVGKNGVTYGYANTLKNYKSNYDSPEKMGRLSFKILQVKKITNEVYFVIGKWDLQRTVGNIGGHYTLLFRKLNGEWKIVNDHSS